MKSKKDVRAQYTLSSTLASECQRLGIPLNEINFKDRITLPLRDGFYIINMADSSAGQGTHWVGIWKEGKEVLYFDSFGMPAPRRFNSFVTSYNNFQIQNERYGKCGGYNIEFGQWMNDNKNRIRNPRTRFRAFLDNFKLDSMGKGNAKILTELQRD